MKSSLDVETVSTTFEFKDVNKDQNESTLKVQSWFQLKILDESATPPEGSSKKMNEEVQLKRSERKEESGSPPGRSDKKLRDEVQLEIDSKMFMLHWNNSCMIAF
jgi:hypothetical protein